MLFSDVGYAILYRVFLHACGQMSGTASTVQNLVCLEVLLYWTLYSVRRRQCREETQRFDNWMCFRYQVTIQMSSASMADSQETALPRA
jgi:hypothetical protein